MQVARETKPVGVRLPEALRQSLKHHAIDNNRSLQSEILERLEASIRPQDAAVQPKKKA